MARNPRVKVTLSRAMTVALELQAERTALPIAAVTRQILRTALDRTIHSAECQSRLRLLDAELGADIELAPDAEESAQ